MAFIMCFTTEFLQKIMPYGRSFDYYDMMANSCGIIVGLLFFNYIRKQIKKSQILNTSDIKKKFDETKRDFQN